MQISNKHMESSISFVVRKCKSNSQWDTSNSLGCYNNNNNNNENSKC